MRVLFTVSDWPSHWFSMVPLGWALQAAGHEVRVVCPPAQAEPLSRAGLMPVPVLEKECGDILARIGNFSDAQLGRWPFAELPPHPVTGEPVTSLDAFEPVTWLGENRKQLSAASRRSTDAAVEFARWWRPRLVVHDLLSLEGPLTGKVLGVPSLLHLWGPFAQHDGDLGPGLLPIDFSRAFRRHGLTALLPDTYEHVIDPCPVSVAPPLGAARRHPVRHVPYNGPGVMPTWLPTLPTPGERPRVCVVWSTAVTGMFGPSTFPVPRVVEALAALDVEVLITVTGSDRQRIGELPPGMRLLELTPLQLLLPACDLVIHHGGGGCAMTALAAGIPQLMLSNGWDQGTIANRIAASGAGLAVPNAAADPAAIRAAATALLGDGAHRATAKRLRQEMESQPDPAELVTSLCELAEGAALAAR